MAQLFHGDCLEEMKNIDDNSVDLIFCDLPYNCTSCKWDQQIIDLDKFWIEIMRIKKLKTPIFMTCTTRFGVELIRSAPKKCPFKYDLCWKKSCPTGFLLAKKQPLRIFEMIYVFYEKTPFYDISSHKHKFLTEKPDETIVKVATEKKENVYGNMKAHNLCGKKREARYEPPLPQNILDFQEPEPEPENMYSNAKSYEKEYRKKGRSNGAQTYDPPLPNNMLEIKSTRGKFHSTEKPVALTSWILKYYSKEGDVVLDATMGSGGMGVSCRDMNRNFIGIEKDDKIFEIACERINC